MKHVILLLGLWLLSCVPGYAQFNGCPPGLCNVKPAASAYVGPGDAVPGATGWWSVARAYNTAYATGSNNGFLLERSSDSTTHEILVLSNGLTDRATAATFCAATTCYVKTLHNESGGGSSFDLTQTLLADMPQYQDSCINSVPCMVWSGASGQYLASGSVSWGASPPSISTVAERTANFTTEQNVLAIGAANDYEFLGSNQAFMYCGSGISSGSTATNSTPLSLSYICHTGINVNGTLTSGDSGGGSPGTTQASMGSFTGTSRQLIGYISEAGLWGSYAFTTTDQTNLCHSQRLFYALGGTC